MSTIHLYDNKTGAWAGATAAGAQFTLGVPFSPLLSVSVTQLRWYRAATGAGFAPTRLCLWDVPTQALIADPAVPDNLAVGWQSADLTTPVTLIAGREYRISQTISAGVSIARSSSGARGTPPYPLAFTANLRAWASGFAFPSNVDSADALGIDITTDSEGIGVVPGDLATVGDVANQLASWLSVDDSTHSDSAPIQDHATLATVNGNVSDVKDQQAEWAFGLGVAAHGYFGDLKGLIANIKTVTDTLPTPIAQLTSIVLDHYTADIALILDQIDTVLSNLGAQSTDLSGTAGSAVGSLSARTGFPSGAWSMSAEADFEDAIALAEPADAYVLSITSYQPSQPANEGPAGLWLPRLGWWCVLTGSLAASRAFVEFQQQLLSDQGRRMPGCAIQLRPGTIAHVQAWLLA